MIDGDVELEDVEVVNVSGTGHRDKPHKYNNNKCECNRTLRCTTILIFVCVAVVYVAGVAVGNVLMFNSLETLDIRQSNRSINRISMLIKDDMVKLEQLVKTYGNTEVAVEGINNLMEHPDWDPEYSVYNFTWEKLNNTYTYDGSGNITGKKYGVSLEINYWAMLDLEYNTKYAVYYPKGPGDTGVVGTTKQFPPPVVKASLYSAIIKEAGEPRFLKMLIPNEGDDKPMFVSLQPITNPSDTSDPKTIYGYIVGGRSLLPRMKQIAEDAPTCVVMQDGPSGENSWDKDDLDMFAKVKNGTFAPNKNYGGAASFMKRVNATIQKTPGRLCPKKPLFPATSVLMVGYFSLCGLDPEKYKEDAGCVFMRVDRPMSMVDQGTAPVISLSVTIVVLMVVLCIIFVMFLDCVVLRRIVNLSNVIKKQTKGHAAATAAAQREEDETTATLSLQEGGGGKSGKSSSRSGRSASGTSDTTNSSDAEGPKSAAPQPKNALDEIENLKRAMEQNAQGLRKRLEVINENIKTELQKALHQKQAVQLMNLWCDRKDYFPGLRPNAAQLRYEPTRNVDDLLANPLAIEFLKNHCEGDRTLENLWFILDVSWLQDLETAEDNEDDQIKRGQIHDVATCAAKTIMQRYIVENAPQQINISAGTFKKLRESGEKYSRKMFDEAVSEVKLLLNTDILPRFQKSAAYSAMSEALYIDTSGDNDESSFSNDTVSTTGSILTEDGEGGVSRVFSHTFKNLHTAFEVGHDDSTASSGHVTAAGAVPSQSEASGNATSTTSGDKDKSKDKKEKDEKEDEEKEEKKVSEESSDSSSSKSSDSSSNDSSSDSE